MRRALFLLATLAFGAEVRAQGSGSSQAPSYSAAGIVNAASNLQGALAPNGLVSIYGTNLSRVTRGLSPEDISSGTIPTSLPGTGVKVVIGGLQALMFYVSPLQINFQIPSILKAGEVDVQVVREGWAGPAVRVRLLDAAPGLFQMDPDYLVAAHADWRVITAELPARPGEIVILYATGLGRTVPHPGYGEIPVSAAWIQRAGELDVLLNGVPVERSMIEYAGVAPYFAGVYQINLRLPAWTPADPDVQLAIGGQISRPGVRLHVQP